MPASDHRDRRDRPDRNGRPPSGGKDGRGTTGGAKPGGSRDRRGSGDAPKRLRTAGPSPDRTTPPTPPDTWIDEGRVGESAGSQRSTRSSGSRGRDEAIDRGRRRRPVSVDAPELTALVGTKRAATLRARLGEAASAFAGERFSDARRILKPIVAEAPGSATARELYGLTLYRLGKWRDALRQLEELNALEPGSTGQHPVLADCNRALGRYDRVDELWLELREASPSSELVNEGRIVMAGSLADRGRLADAIRTLEKGWRAPRRPADHHLRRAYALADLYEQAGEIPRARALFMWIDGIDPEFSDVAERRSHLS